MILCTLPEIYLCTQSSRQGTCHYLYKYLKRQQQDSSTFIVPFIIQRPLHFVAFAHCLYWTKVYQKRRMIVGFNIPLEVMQCYENVAYRLKIVFPLHTCFYRHLLMFNHWLTDSENISEVLNYGCPCAKKISFFWCLSVPVVPCQQSRLGRSDILKSGF